MEPFLPLLLDAWREACRHAEIGEFAAKITPVLLDRLPLSQLYVRQLDLSRREVRTVGVGLPGEEDKDRPRRSEIDPVAAEALSQWARGKRLIEGVPREVEARLPGLLPPNLVGSVVAGPLHRDGDPIGGLVLVTDGQPGFDPHHRARIEALLEPFAAAMDNDRRLRELRALREAVEAENRSLRSRLGRQDIADTVVGRESGLQSVMERVELVGPSDAPVLILGETGSGKEVVARAIHSRSTRASGPFLRVNCGAIPPELIDSQLFGHEKGSFTGAVALRKGWFERADGGTLFLDEIGELPQPAQVRLLRVLQDGTFERVGGERQVGVDVRMVAATHRNLQQMVRQGRFREDLWYRICVFPIRLPSLRERREDIPALAAHFAIRASKRLGNPPLLPTPADNQLLVSYGWPGNARELSAVMERAAILGGGKRLEVAKALGGAEHLQPAGPHPASLDLGDTSSRWETLDEVAASHIVRALEHTGGRIEGPHGVGALLGINPHTLRSRMRKLGIDWTRYRAHPSGHAPG